MSKRDRNAGLAMVFGLGLAVVAPYVPLLPWWVGVTLMVLSVVGWLMFEKSEGRDAIVGCEYTDQHRWEITVSNHSRVTLYDIQLSGAEIGGLVLSFSPVTYFRWVGRPSVSITG